MAWRGRCKSGGSQLGAYAWRGGRPRGFSFLQASQSASGTAPWWTSTEGWRHSTGSISAAAAQDCLCACATRGYRTDVWMAPEGSRRAAGRSRRGRVSRGGDERGKRVLVLTSPAGSVASAREALRRSRGGDGRKRGRAYDTRAPQPVGGGVQRRGAEHSWDAHHERDARGVQEDGHRGGRRGESEAQNAGEGSEGELGAAGR